jgi:predicted nucleotidyltransferase
VPFPPDRHPRLLGDFPRPEASVKSYPNSMVARKFDVINLYGSFARNQKDATSDIDLLVIGNTNGDALAEAIHKLERQLGREIK